PMLPPAPVINTTRLDTISATSAGSSRNSSRCKRSSIRRLRKSRWETVPSTSSASVGRVRIGNPDWQQTVKSRLISEGVALGMQITTSPRDWKPAPGARRSFGPIPATPQCVVHEFGDYRQKWRWDGSAIQDRTPSPLLTSYPRHLPPPRQLFS